MAARTVVGMAIVTFVDETTAGERGAGRRLEVAEERLTVRELIRRRVFEEATENPEAQSELALRAFAANGILVLVGDRQVTEPDEEIELVPGTEVTFLKLVPLVGG